MTAAGDARSPGPHLESGIGRADGGHVYVRGKDLVNELMGHISFTDMTLLMITGRLPDRSQRRLLDTILVSLADHGLTPSALIARATYSTAPEALQGAVAAGLLSAGSRTLGSMENCGRMLSQAAALLDAGEDVAAAARETVAEYRRRGWRIPGLGHALHAGGDPRADRLLQVAAEEGYAGRYVQLLREVAAEAERVTGRSLPVNVTGAIAAVLLELGLEWEVFRGFALISRAAGLVAHIQEERQRPLAPALRQLLHP